MVARYKLVKGKKQAINYAYSIEFLRQLYSSLIFVERV